jgi:hypothetical protein
MRRDQAPSSKAPEPDDDARTEEATRVVGDYATALREMLQKLRRFFN